MTSRTEAKLPCSRGQHGNTQIAPEETTEQWRKPSRNPQKTDEQLLPEEVIGLDLQRLRHHKQGDTRDSATAFSGSNSRYGDAGPCSQ